MRNIIIKNFKNIILELHKKSETGNSKELYFVLFTDTTRAIVYCFGFTLDSQISNIKVYVQIYPFLY